MLAEITRLANIVLEAKPGKLSGRGGGGGGYSIYFFAYIGSDPASTVHPKKNQKFQAPRKIFEIFATPKNIPILYIYLKKRP